MKAKVALTAVLLAVMCAGPVALAQDAPRIPLPPLRDLLWERAESVVSIKFVLKIQMSMAGQSQDREQNSEVRGMLVSDDGLIITANSHFDGGIPAPLRRMLGSQVDVKATPTDVKVLFGNEVEEYDAQLVARDSNLGLAFVQIMDLKGRKVTPVLLQDFATINVGDEMVGVTRMSRGFDCAPAVSRLFVKAQLEKPRSMWAISGDDGASLEGLPVFNRIGVPVGIVSIQSASEGVTEEPDMFTMRSMADNVMAVVLPLAEVARTLKAAQTRAAEALEEFKEKSAEDEGAGGTDEGEKPGEEKTPEDEGK